jgi:hypothetical protein
LIIIVTENQDKLCTGILNYSSALFNMRQVFKLAQDTASLWHQVTGNRYKIRLMLQDSLNKVVPVLFGMMNIGQGR